VADDDVRQGILSAVQALRKRDAEPRNAHFWPAATVPAQSSTPAFAGRPVLVLKENFPGLWREALRLSNFSRACIICRNFTEDVEKQIGEGKKWQGDNQSTRTCYYRAKPVAECIRECYTNEEELFLGAGNVPNTRLKEKVCKNGRLHKKEPTSHAVPASGLSSQPGINALPDSWDGGKVL
jgi:hypothetical protein